MNSKLLKEKILGLFIYNKMSIEEYNVVCNRRSETLRSSETFTTYLYNT